ncbi:MAG: response regulator [Bacteroidales bacterium]|nr:response regulator [Bacteroidales bacterium]
MKKLIIIGVLLWLSQGIRSQFNCLFEHYSTRDGLSHGSVSDIMKDSKGFMWFSTFDGINKFDGYTFTTYKARPGDNTSLSSNRVILLTEDKWGFIWVQTYDSAVYRFDPRTEMFESVLKNTDGTPLSVKKVFKSSLSDIWLTTGNNGIYRIATRPSDYTTNVFQYKKSPGNPLSLYSNAVLSVFEDTEKQIWVSTKKGLNCLQYDKNKNNFVYRKFSQHMHEELKRYCFVSFTEHANRVWMGSHEGLLFCFDRAKQDLLKTDLAHGHSVTCMTGSPNGSLYIGTAGDGIYRYDIAEMQVKQHFSNAGLNYVINLFIDSYNILWIETDRDGIMKLNPDFSGFRHFTQPTDVDLTYMPRSACGWFEDEKHIVWVLLKGGGFGYYDREADNLAYFFNKPGDPASKMSNYVNCFYKDSADVLWLSTYYRGIEKITFLENKFRFMTFGHSIKSLIPNEVRALFEDSEGFLWVGTKNGTLYLLDHEKKILRQFSSEIDHGMVYSITEDRENNIWLGTKGKGLYKARRAGRNKTDYNFTCFRHDPQDPGSLSSDLIYSVVQDSKDRIWIGTFGQGLNLLTNENGHVTFNNSNNAFTNYPEVKGRRIRHIKEDGHGLLWIATTEGLILTDSDKGDPGNFVFEYYYKGPGDKNSLGSNDIYCIFIDRTDSLWLGTLGGGLHKMISRPENGRAPRFMVYTKDDGLPSDVILSIEADGNNNIWMSTENGIACLNRHNGTIKCYDEYDGLHSSSFSEATSLTRSNREMLFGTMEGLYTFFPEDFTDEAVITNLVLTRFRLFNQDVMPGIKGSPLKRSINETDEIRLNYKQSMFSIEYAGLDYSAQHKMQYAYLLEGLDSPDSGWHYVNNQRIATYTNVPPGEYLFRVRFVNPELRDINPERTLAITIKPPPWKTLWAYAVYVVILLLLLETARRIAFTMIRLRNRVTVEKEITNAKLRFFTNISHELRTPLSLIIGPVEEVSRTEKLSAKGIEHMQLVEKNAKRLLKFINQLLDFRKIQNNKMILKLAQVDLIVFAKEIYNNFRELAEEKSIDFKFSTDVDHMDVWIDEEKMDIVFFNLLSNAFKFTPAGRVIEVSISHNVNRNIVSIAIRDEGIGIPSDKIPVIFSRFADIHDHKINGHTGTGIGLSLSKELIDLHGGAISFNSTEGKGTTFIIELKTGKSHFNTNRVEFIERPQITKAVDRIVENFVPQNSERDIDGTEAGYHDKALMLVVEDDDDLRRFLNDLLSGTFMVEEAVNGQEGLDKAIEYIPDIVITDVMMPELDGIELLNRLKNNFATSHIPVILLTAKSSIESRIEGLKYGADAYITKPFNSQYLMASARNLLEQRKLLLKKYTSHISVLDFAQEEIIVTDKDDEFLQTVVGIIEDNISISDFKIETIAQRLGLGRTSFFKKIKGMTGKSPIDFVNEFRLQKAARMLMDGGHNISEVSYSCGFSDPGYFSKRFRERFKASPREYRKKERGRG